ncbi:type VI secretion system baseplate subunit TssK [Alteromonas sp. ASW11-130]|uniref:type VI secretion system baseplate subunit TssK n=1 Tax=Alteromonas sp. ASW11-130 TaxID=3015775 RepID=UPI002241AFA0|nr:type VI secretion system baseplate subunit TssK [Alteromonas sp. ASW11-130]MCW8090303.1 type VI secretion system baseplate subunit TssK [Alteromonas sp. ASW11-130]
MEYPVIWKEGTFVLPQHFQQQERFILSQIFRQTSTFQPHFWGLNSLSINKSDLDRGIINVESISGCFPDGTCFNCPSPNPLPSQLNLSESDSNSIIHITLARQSNSQCNIDYDKNSESHHRYTTKELSVIDCADNGDAHSPILVGDLNLKLALESKTKEIADNVVSLPIAKVKSVNGNRITLCADFIPVIIDISLSERLAHFISELHAMFTSRGDALSNRVSGSGRTTGVTEYSEFLLLQLINRVEPYLYQISKGIPCHPHQFYLFLISLAGELSTYMKSKRRPTRFPVYNHNDLTDCFNLIINDINASFDVVIEQTAIQIELSKPKNGIRAARLNHKSLLRNSTIILAVSASIAEDVLRNEFPAQIKIGPGEKIFSLIQSALPGIKINLLSHVPPELPYRSGYCYFQLDKASSLWPELEESKGLAIHVSGNYPDLVMELWALKKK